MSILESPLSLTAPRLTSHGHIKQEISVIASDFDFGSGQFELDGGNEDECVYSDSEDIEGSEIASEEDERKGVDIELVSPKRARLSMDKDVAARRNAETTKRSRPRPKCYHCSFDGCGKSFTRPCRLEEHIRSHTGERPFVCTFENCGKTFLRDSHLKAHESSHSTEKRYACTLCGHGFNTNQHLKRHMLTHEKDKPYQCTEYAPCDESFHKQTQLRKHIADVHTHSKPFMCPAEGCGRSFMQNSRLKAHEARDHSTQARYICGHLVVVPAESVSAAQGADIVKEVEDGMVETTCNQRFQTWSALQKHRKADHKTICGVCGLVCTFLSSLREHMRVHEVSLEERRKFVCEFCQRGFTRRNALLVHTSTVHENKRPFVCDYVGCAKAFGHKRLLKDHVAKVHEQHVSGTTLVEAEGMIDTSSIDSMFQVDMSTSHSVVSSPATSHRLRFTSSSPASVGGTEKQQSRSAKTRRPLIIQGDVIDRLTGTGYEEGRHIPCSFPDCDYRFAREYDLSRHLDSHHAIAVNNAMVGLSVEEQYLDANVEDLGCDRELANLDVEFQEVDLQLVDPSLMLQGI
ncbi:uncharacterized protein V1518DRAFT_409692 [Limtongia smithiae]|uniref:uncharacterized protein n=1 Tax=Limtongia smithiae TaxID=1125753 RepID=UPI0034CF268E